MELFDIDKAIDYVREQLSEPAKSSMFDEDIETVIEMILDYYEDNGLLDLDPDVDDPSAEEVAAYICQKISSVEPEYAYISNIIEIVKAESGYEQKLLE